VIDKACGTAPHRDVTAFEAQTAHGIGAAFTAPQEYGGQAKRDRDDRSPGIFLVTVLMEAEFGARDIAVDQASVRIVVGEAGLGSGARTAMSTNAAGIAGQGAPVQESTES